MCTTLLQTYACGHIKPICITPCPHAIATTLSPNRSQSQSPARHRRPPPTPITELPSYNPRTNYCPYSFPPNLPASRYPCLMCYLQPEWAAYRASYMEWYKKNHEGERLDRLEEMSGVAMIPARVGLVNVVREMDRMTSLRGNGGRG